VLRHWAANLDLAVITAAYCDGVSGPDRSAPGRLRFPALDPEPPPRPWWWRALFSAGVLAAAGAVAAAVAFWPFASGPARPGTAAAESGWPAAPPTASATVTRVTPDSRIELRAAGRPAVVLATAGGLDRDLGYPRSLSAALIPYPSPSGTEIAVTVLPAAGGLAGIVILSRSGRVLGTAAGSLGPPAWSPSGTSLAYAATGSGGSALRIWKAGGRAVTLTLPLPPTGGSFSRYIWSPDGMSVLCAPSFEADSGDWEVASAAGGSRPLAVRGPGLPVAWLPLAGGR